MADFMRLAVSICCVTFVFTSVNVAAEPTAPKSVAVKSAAPRQAEAATDAGRYWDDGKRGWFWYELPPVEIIPEKDEDKKVGAVPESGAEPKPKPPEVVQHEKQLKELEDLKIIAIISPTTENIKKYMFMQQRLMNQASTFSDVWRRVVWQTPELDYSAQGGRPTNNTALTAYDENLGEKQRQTVRQLGKTHGLFFFFSGDCGYCHKFAPILKRFEQTYGITVFPISLDGGGLPDFPNPSVNNGIAQQLNVRQVPALFLAVPGSKEVTPIATGVIADSELLNRIYTLTQTKPGEPY